MDSPQADQMATRIGVQHVRRIGDSLVVTIPDDVAERLGIIEGSLVDVSIDSLVLRPRMSPELKAAFDEVW